MERGDRGLRLCTVDLEASFLARVASHCSARSGFARCSVLAASRRRRRRSRRGVAVETAGARRGLAARGGKPRRPECAGFRVSSRGGLPPRGMTGTTPRPAAEGFREAAAPVPARSASTPSMARFTRSSLDSTPRARSAGSESRPGRMGEAGGSGRGPGPWPAIAGQVHAADGKLGRLKRAQSRREFRQGAAGRPKAATGLRCRGECPFRIEAARPQSHRWRRP